MPPLYPLVPASAQSRRTFITGATSLALAVLSRERAWGAVKMAMHGAALRLLRILWQTARPRGPGIFAGQVQRGFRHGYAR